MSIHELKVKACLNKLKRLHDISSRASEPSADSHTTALFRAMYEDLPALARNFEDLLDKYLNSASKKPCEATVWEPWRVEFDEKYYEIKVTFNTLFPDNSQSSSALSAVNEPQESALGSSSERLPLPKLDIPTFSGSLSEWLAFYDLFTHLVHNNQHLSGIEKFMYLRLSLKGDPLSLVSTLPLTSDNYKIAWESLKCNYEDPRLITSHYLNSLLNLPMAVNHNPASIKHLLKVIAETVGALVNLNHSVEEWSPLLIHIFQKSLDYQLRSQWERTLADSRFPSYTLFVEFLKSQARIATGAAEAASQKDSRRGGGPPQLRPPSHPPPRQILLNSAPPSSPSHGLDSPPSPLATADQKRYTPTQHTPSAPSPNCPFCNKADAHPRHSCAVFTDSSPQVRKELTRKKGLCFNCLHNHPVNSCKSKFNCRHCNKRHHTLLHDVAGGASRDPATDQHHASLVTTTLVTRASTTVASDDTNRLSSLVGNTSIPSKHSSHVLLSTALACYHPTSGEPQTLRLLLDCGSQATLITDDCVQRLNLKTTKVNVPLIGLGQCELGFVKGITTLHISSIRNPENVIELQPLIVPHITHYTPTPMLTSHLTQSLGVELADEDHSAPIDILLGADVFPFVLLGGRRVSDQKSPAALETIFGWVLMGRMGADSIPRQTLHVQTPEFDIKKFWEMEEPPTLPGSEVIDKRCEAFYIRTTHRNDSGRYVVALPFKSDPPIFKGTRQLAVNRLQSLEKRISKNPLLLSAYQEFMNDYLQQGHMEKITSPPSDNGAVYYIPHHCIIKPGSNPPKIRVVFDASMISSENPTLNSLLPSGSKLQQDISAILLSFRFHRYALTCDVKQMFRQILVRPTDQDYQRIVWRASPDAPIECYRLTTVTYGTTSAPFLALRTLQQLAEDEGHRFPRAAAALRSSTYIDDIVTGADSEDSVQALQQELTGLFNAGCFDLHKWLSNSERLMHSIPQHSQAGLSSWSVGSEELVGSKILGLQWQPRSDTFHYQIDIPLKPITKRSILSDLGRIYDPLGFLAPLTFQGKLLLQHLWLLSLDWDEHLPDTIVHQWEEFRKSLPLLSSLSIPRFIPHSINVELHGFSDSSEKGYAAVVYLRTLNPDQSWSVYILMGKSKVAPLKRLSLPRLELAAALLLAKLMRSIADRISEAVPIQQLHAWTDSSVTLHWIKGSPHNWKTFVANRVSEIHRLVDPSIFRHVPGHENPADCGSRGTSPAELIHHPLWWTGPKWLQSGSSQWPVFPAPSPIDPDTDLEHKVQVLSLREPPEDWALLDRFSSLTKLQRVTAYCLRFISHAKNPRQKRTGPLSTDELSASLNKWILMVQTQAFAKVLNELRKQSISSSHLRSLNPFLDDAGILRVGGRIKYARTPYDQRHPILLPKDNKFTHLVIDHFHHLYLHPGLQSLHFLIKQRFWIIGAKRIIRQRIRQCHTCFRANPTPLAPLMGDLPAPRIQQVKPFAHTGVDYCGPFFITMSRSRGSKRLKSYVCLFVCFATKAVHLELVSDLSTPAFLAALRRFVARRGRCSNLYSDCGTNFIGAQRELAKLAEKAAMVENITWSFNPPSAPHMGGLWEAGVKSVKHHLARVIGEQLLTYEEFYTVLTQTEAVLNSRPLCPLSTDPNDLSALTPGHFLTLEPLTSLPEPDLTNDIIPVGQRWTLLTKIHQDIWKAWHNEYLHTLQQRYKWQKGQDTLKVDQLVLIKEDCTPPLHWRMGRVIANHAGRDGITRVASVRTRSGVVQRPVRKLCPFPEGN